MDTVVLALVLLVGLPVQSEQVQPEQVQPEKVESENSTVSRTFQALVSHCMQMTLSPVSITGPRQGAEERGAFYRLNEPPLSVYIGRLTACLQEMGPQVELEDVETDSWGVPIP